MLPRVRVKRTDEDLLPEWCEEKNGPAPPKFKGLSVKKVWWRCGLGHEWEAIVASRRNGSGCPKCPRRVTRGVSDLQTMRPDIAAEWDHGRNHPLVPSIVAFSSGKKVWWRCGLGHGWEAEVSARTSKGKSDCPYCSNQKILPGYNDLATHFPDLAAEWAQDLNSCAPDSVAPKSGIARWWRCSAGHTWEAAPRTRHKSGCPYCAGQKVDAGSNSLQFMFPDAAAEWDEERNGCSASEVVGRSGAKRWWRCAAGHTWGEIVRNRTIKGYACPTCSGSRATPGFNDLASLYPEVAARWDFEKNDLLPSEIHAASGRPVWWKCPEGHEEQRACSTMISMRAPYYCARCTSGLQTSEGEDELYAYVSGLLGPTNVEQTYHGLPGVREVDIYVPGKKIAVEYNGVFWHSSARKIDPNAHRTKLRACQAAGVQLIQIWEDDWVRRPLVVKAMLAHKLGASPSPRVYARKCRVVSVSAQQAGQFLNQHHIQGTCGGSIREALLHEGRLVAVALFRQDPHGTLQLTRYATSQQVLGGLGKLLSHVVRTYKPRRIVTFADLCVSLGGLYETLGFHAEAELAPDYKYLVRGERRHKFQYRIKRFREDPDLQYYEGMTERELADLNSLHRVYDAGKTRYVLTCS